MLAAIWLKAIGALLRSFERQSAFHFAGQLEVSIDLSGSAKVLYKEGSSSA
jgi:hypothetical protein